MISISLSPNSQKDDVLLAIKTVLNPGIWKNGDTILYIQQWFEKYFNVSLVKAYNSGRSALYAILCSFGIRDGDEVIVQAYSCLAVSEVIKWVGGKPIFVDIDETFNIDVHQLELKITKKTKAIIIQNTFGTPAEIEKILKIARTYKLLVIEDCAHSLGAEYKMRKIGSFGDAAFFSFGRDKVVSCVFGGVAILANKYKNTDIEKKFINQWQNSPEPSYFWILQQLFHPIAFSVILPTYEIYVGKILLYLLQKARLLSFPIFTEEKVGMKPSIFPARLPNALALLAIKQLGKIESYNSHRRMLSNYYRAKLSNIQSIQLPIHIEGAIYLRYTILINNPREIMKAGKKHGILLGNWYHECIDPENTSKIAGYTEGSCVTAERIAAMSVNLPTNINTSLEDAKKIVSFLKRKYE